MSVTSTSIVVVVSVSIVLFGVLALAKYCNRTRFGAHPRSHLRNHRIAERAALDFLRAFHLAGEIVRDSFCAYRAI